MPTSALNYPSGVAVDGSGNVYIADTYNSRVLVETLSAGSYSESVMPTGGFYEPNGVTVDENGNVYIDYSNYGLVLKETLLAGSYAQSVVPTITLSDPGGVAVDGSGNVYITDFYNQDLLKEDFADPPSLGFASTVVGSTSSDSPQTVTVGNIGNAALSISVPAAGSNPSISTNFTLNSSGASACPLVNAGSSTAGTLFPGRSCLLPVSFTPTTTETLSGTLSLTDNALNTTAPSYTTQSILLSGAGGSQQSIAFKAIPAQTVNSAVALTATASSGLAVNFTSTTPTTCTVSSANSMATLLAAGTCTIQANQPGNRAYGAAPAVAQSFTVHPDMECQPSNSGRETITSISPAAWFAGKTYNITITGVFPANAPEATLPGCTYDQVSVAFTASNNGSDGAVGTYVTVSNPAFHTSTQTTATVTIAANAPSGTAYVYVTCDGCPIEPTASVPILPTPQIQCGPSMQCSGQTISGDNPTPQSAVVGQKIELDTNVTSLPAGLTLSKNTWTLGGTNIGDRPLVLPGGGTSSASTKDTVLTNANLTTYWIYPKNNVPVTYQYCVNMPGLSAQDLAAQANCSLEATATFNVSGPSASVHPRAYLPNAYAYWYVTPPLVGCNNAQDLVFGFTVPGDNSCDPAREFYGIDFLATGITNVPSSGGSFFWIQLVDSNNDTFTTTGGQTISAPAGTGLDNTYPYSDDLETADSPLPTLTNEAGWAKQGRTFSARMYLMWQLSIDANAIAVPIGYVTWSIQGGATNRAGQNPPWALSAPGSTSPVYQQSTDVGQSHGMPTWSSLASNSQ